MASRIRLIDIGANLVDEMFEGIYNGTRKHEPDLVNVLKRSYTKGVEQIFVTSGNLDEAEKTIELVSRFSSSSQEEIPRLYSTIGVHPTRCSEFTTKYSTAQIYIDRLKRLYDQNPNKIVALGEFGLDFDRIKFCDIETQKKYFALQLSELSGYTGLPMFLHCRGTGAAAALVQILSNFPACLKNGGVVHSFDGSQDEMATFLSLGLYIGINGCSLKTEENCAVVRQIPIDRLLLETDSPWCGIRPSHVSFKHLKTKLDGSKNWTSSSMYKQRNEPQTLLNILEIVASLKGISETELADTVYQNTVKCFCLK